MTAVYGSFFGTPQGHDHTIFTRPKLECHGFHGDSAPAERSGVSSCLAPSSRDPGFDQLISTDVEKNGKYKKTSWKIYSQGAGHPPNSLCPCGWRGVIRVAKFIGEGRFGSWVAFNCHESIHFSIFVQHNFWISHGACFFFPHVMASHTPHTHELAPRRLSPILFQTRSWTKRPPRGWSSWQWNTEFQTSIYIHIYYIYIYNNLKDQICTIINYLQHLSEMRKKCWTKYLSMCIFTLPHPCQFLTCNSRKPCLVVQMASMHYHWVLRHGSHDVYMRLAVSSFEFTLVNCYDNL